MSRKKDDFTGDVEPTMELPKQVKDPEIQKNYGNYSLCWLTVTNPFRRVVINILLSPWFDRIILLVILVNCIFLAIDDPKA